MPPRPSTSTSSNRAPSSPPNRAPSLGKLSGSPPLLRAGGAEKYPRHPLQCLSPLSDGSTGSLSFDIFGDNASRFVEPHTVSNGLTEGRFSERLYQAATEPWVVVSLAKISPFSDTGGNQGPKDATSADESRAARRNAEVRVRQIRTAAPRRRAEYTLLAVVQDAYVRGVSMEGRRAEEGLWQLRHRRGYLGLPASADRAPATTAQHEPARAGPTASCADSNACRSASTDSAIMAPLFHAAVL